MKKINLIVVAALIKNLFPFVLLSLVILTGCTPDSVNTPVYSGKSLVVGVIGKTPDVREDNVSFRTIAFDQLDGREKLSNDVDAIFIMQDNLSEASNSKYAITYKTAGVPFFFIGSKKSVIPFIVDEISYENGPDVNTGFYAAGYYQSEGKGQQQWGYGLYNDKLNDPNIKDAYSRIFTTIESIKNEKSK